MDQDKPNANLNLGQFVIRHESLFVSYHTVKHLVLQC